MRGSRPRPGGPPRPGQAQQPSAVTERYAKQLVQGTRRQKEKKTGNLVFRIIFFIGFAVTALVLGPNYQLRGPLISFGLIGLMFVGVVLIDMVMWKCSSCGRYMGVMPWPGQRCKKCRVKFF